ncbi:PREDICTED: DNA (cytosine-5)-methyltransferase 3A-like [Nicrophorus vespilloides]|uniref:DNA (cytosine-5-)-methyltransferase n=1 Tax=Nicrophorus vespilloides TaxID=110193 RepID=A0ABM1M6A2_NICVS|nr:PREDICTED: DNA (cytosine-5)-methyltransferase 3A-like [Nicrophorus vespilloides]
MGDPKGYSVLWGKFGRIFWPALVLPSTLVHSKANDDNIWVFWFGDHTFSQVKKANIVNFEEYFKDKTITFFRQNTKQSDWLKAIYEAIKIYSKQRNLLVDNWKSERLLKWALNGFPRLGEMSENFTLPEWIVQKLDELNKTFEVETESESDDDYDALFPIRITNQREFEIMCIGCYSFKILHEHPIFFGNICKICQTKLIKTLFMFGDDDAQYCCSICGDFGNLILCSSSKCGRGFCAKCIDILKDDRKSILEQDNWLCYICSSSPRNSKCFIQLREDWMERVHTLFNEKLIFKIPSFPKKKLRVLSVFDGIGTGLVALNKLNIDVEIYYAIEIDENAIEIVHSHFKNVEHLGDIKGINENTLLEICPIDLILAGSPCNDLSRANPLRKGLYEPSGTGILFFYFFKILTTMAKINGPFFWLFENVSSMNIKNKNIISRFLMCEPTMVSAAWVSPQRRERFFWGNLPTLQCNFENKGPTLEEYLGSNRKALCEKVNTITTKRNSLYQGNENKYPVFDETTMENDVLTINEIESVFGFDIDYTNVSNIGVSSRQELLGKAWSVQVSCLLLRCLKQFYRSTN